MIAISALASGDQPSGRRPASDWPPMAVSVTFAPGVSDDDGTVSSTLRVTAVSATTFSASGVDATIVSVPRIVRRMSIGTTPAPAGTTI